MAEQAETTVDEHAVASRACAGFPDGFLHTMHFCHPHSQGLSTKARSGPFPAVMQSASGLVQAEAAKPSHTAEQHQHASTLATWLHQSADEMHTARYNARSHHTAECFLLLLLLL